jgi:hypothetical protein
MLMLGISVGCGDGEANAAFSGEVGGCVGGGGDGGVGGVVFSGGSGVGVALMGEVESGVDSCCGHLQKRRRVEHG